MIPCRRVALIIMPGLAALVLSVDAQTNLIDSESFRDGCEAFAEGDFGAAAVNFQDAWSLLGNETNSFNRKVVAARLIESWYRNGDKQTAVAWYRGVATLDLTGETRKWAALAMLDTGFYEESSRIFKELAAGATRKTRREMSILQAHALVRNGASERAYRMLFPDFEIPTNAAEAWFFAGIAYETNRWSEALSYCDMAAGWKGEPEEFYTRVAILKARCLTGSGKSLEAVTLVLNLIDTAQDSQAIYPLFDVLMQIASANEREVLATQFDLWAKNPSFPNRQMAAKYYSILIDSDPNEEYLVEKLLGFIYQHSNHSLAHEARLMLGSIRPDLAMKIKLGENFGDSAELRQYIDFASAVKQFQQESFSTAKKTFLEISNQLKGRQKDQALFNSAIAALYEGDNETFTRIEKDFAKDGSVASAMHADLLFLGGLFYASKASPVAFSLLSKFISSYPEHTSVVDAKLALAEMHLNQVPPQPTAAKEFFKELDKVELSLPRKERLSYAKVWAELLDPGSNKTLEKATAFLVEWPYSSLRPEVSMLLATEFYQQRRFEAAEEAFLLVARDFPNSIHRETALFFAAKAREFLEPDFSPESQNWDEVIAAGGNLAHHARHQKAINLLKQDQFDEAIAVLDEILETNEIIESDLRIAAGCDKGYAIFLKALAEGGDPELLASAADEFTGVARDTKATRAWRYQASVRRGKCLEILGRENVALEIYQSLVRESKEYSAPQIGSSPIEENIWLFRAGFAAMEILEKNKDWKGAVKIAEILSQRSGARASEAARKAEKLRLRHFVWD